MNVPPPYWAFAWAGGQALARYLLDNPALVAGPQRARSRRRLGARRHRRDEGRGRARAGGRHRRLRPGRDCASTPRPTASTVETTADDLLAGAPGAFDVVLVGDMFYERPLAERALAFAEAARASGAQVLAGDPRRSYFPKERFRKLAEYSVPVTRELEDAEIKRTYVWRFEAAEAARDT